MALTFQWSNASEFLTNRVASTVRVERAKFLLAPNLFIVGVSKVAVRTNTGCTVIVRLAEGVAAADDGAFAHVSALSLAQLGEGRGAGLILGTVITAAALFGQDTNASAALVEAWALVIFRTPGQTNLIDTDLIVQTYSNGVARS